MGSQSFEVERIPGINGMVLLNLIQDKKKTIVSNSQIKQRTTVQEFVRQGG